MPSSSDVPRSPAETLPIGDPPAIGEAAPEPCLAVILLWSQQEPWHSGELAYLRAAGGSFILGRADDTMVEGEERLSFARWRGGSVEPAAPLLDPHLSRRQLELSARGADAIDVRNLGKVQLLLNGVPVSAATARPGDLLEVERRLLLYVVRRVWPRIEHPTDLGAFPFGQPDSDGIVGESEAAWGLRERVATVAGAEGHVLVTGESGAGKELVARALHQHSPRRAKALVARNAATFPETLVDAELFGNARNFPNVGAPERPGLFGAADGSSLFLDEIGELPPAVQPHLLRVLDRGEYQRLGEAQTRRVDVRLIGATNRPRTNFRADLSARFIHEIPVPDLNARREDVPLLVRSILLRLARAQTLRAQEILFDGPNGLEPRISTAFMRKLATTRWETNVRQLEARLWQALNSSRGPLLDDVAPTVAAAPLSDASVVNPLWHAVAPLAAAMDNEAARIQASLDRHNGAIERAWRDLGLSSRHALRRLIAKHGLVVRKHPGPR